MYGFQAISAHNGWAMAITGASIVLFCLVFLSVLISQLHKMLAFWDNRTKSNTISEISKINIPNLFPADIKETAKLYEPLIEQLGGTFQLVDLYNAAREHDYPHPHLTISSFRQTGILSEVENGLFRWNNK
ncbi:MAG: hypothetical protein RBT11_15035 [Desulfobacterales bacterium]|nr:hypothetical protein [Desulfobacterales bacterium]